MKYQDCNARQKKAYRNIYHAANWLIGGLENTLSDSLPESDEYISAQSLLEDHDRLVQELYDVATTELYDEGSCVFGNQITSYLKDIRFCGKDWLMERCNARVTKLGY